jgi:GAF domain-containing protein
MNTTNESKRLQTLELYRIMDTASEKAFDDLTALASTICEAPISLVSLVDDKRQWFKSRHGLDATETPRDQAFCAYAIFSDEIMVVEDASKDARFENNPLVTGDPRIRFYAGAPLRVASGASLGTLCVIDRVPRKLSQLQLQALATLRDAVISQLELRRTLADLEAIQRIVPMCAWCRKVRISDEAGDAAVWQPLHEYVAAQSVVSHGICQSCTKDAMESGR